MDKISPDTYLDLIGNLTLLSIESDSLPKVLKHNIRYIHQKLCTHEEFQELFEFIKERFCHLADCTTSLNDLSGHKLSRLFVEWNLLLLDLYSLSLTKAMRKHNRLYKNSQDVINPPDSLSPNQKKALYYSIDFVFVLGISSQLLPGVGLPLDMKSEVYQNIQSYFFHMPNEDVDIELLKDSLNAVIELYELKLSVLFKEYIQSHHFNCFLATLFQVSYCPNIVRKICLSRKMKPSQLCSHIEIKKTVEIERYKQYLYDLVHQSPMKFIFRGLIVLIGGSPNNLDSVSGKAVHEKTPKWLLKRCSLYVRDCVMKVDGVKSLILALIEDNDDNVLREQCHENTKPTTVNWNKCDMVARIITNCPLGRCSENDYCSSVLEQVLEIIKSLYYTENNHGEGVVTQPQCRSLMPTLVRVMETMSSSQPSCFKIELLVKLAHPIIACTSVLPEVPLYQRFNAGETIEIVNEQNFSICIETLHEIIVIFHYPPASLSYCLLPFINVLFDLYLYSSTNPTYLSSSVESLVTHVFNNINTCKALALLKHFADLEALESSSTPPSSTSPSSSSLCSPPSLSASVKLEELLFMNDDLKFAPGDSGGIRVVMKPYPERKLNQRSFLETIEQKVSCLLNIISSIKDENVAINIFLLCLQRLTQIVSHEIESENEFFHILISEKNSNVQKWSKNVLLLTLLSGLVERFDNLCMLNLDQIFLFSQVTIERNIKSLQSRQNKMTEFCCKDFQNETLALVIVFLTTIVYDNNEMSPDKWTLAENLVPSLKYLSIHHPLDDVKTSTYELMKTITKHLKCLKPLSSCTLPQIPKDTNKQHTYVTKFKDAKDTIDEKSQAKTSAEKLGFFRRELSLSSWCSIGQRLKKDDKDDDKAKSGQGSNDIYTTHFFNETLPDPVNNGQPLFSETGQDSCHMTGPDPEKVQTHFGTGEPRHSSLASRAHKSVHFSNLVITKEIEPRHAASDDASEDNLYTNNKL